MHIWQLPRPVNRIPPQRRPPQHRTAASSLCVCPPLPPSNSCTNSPCLSAGRLRFGNMLDTFEILTTSGVVLWSRSYAPVGPNIINSLIRDVFIEERITPQPEDAGRKPTYNKEGYTLKWTTAKDLGVIFVVRIAYSHSRSRSTDLNNGRLYTNLSCT